MGTRVGLDIVKKKYEISCPCRDPIHSFSVAHIAQTLYRPRYPGLSDNMENGFNYALMNITKANRNNLIKVLLSTDVQENCFTRSIKIYIKTAPTCFGVITIIRERTI